MIHIDQDFLFAYRIWLLIPLFIISVQRWTNEWTNEQTNERFKKLSTTQMVRTYYFIRSSSTLHTLLYMRSLHTSLKSYLLIILTISERTTADERRSEQHKTTAISIIIDWCLSAYELYICICYQMSFQNLILIFLGLSS